MDSVITVTKSQPLVLMSTSKKLCEEMHLDQFPPIACLYRCEACSVWWARGQLPYQGKEYLIFRVVEPYEDLFRWDDFRGWRYRAEEAHICTNCGEPAMEPAFALFDSKEFA